MTLIAQPVTSQTRLLRCALLVFVLLAGLLAMHAMVMAGGDAPDHMPTGARQVALAGAAMPVQHGCEDSGRSCDRHAKHADPTCASAAVGGGPALPAPAALPPCSADRRGILPALVPDTAKGGRAPPSLAELQLLRI